MKGVHKLSQKYQTLVCICDGKGIENHKKGNKVICDCCLQTYMYRPPSKSTNDKCWRRYGEKGSLLYCWWERKLMQPTVENSMEVPQKTKNRVATWSGNPTPGRMSGKDENSSWKGYITPVFIAALFTIAKTWKQAKCPSTDEWIKKTWYKKIQWDITQP